MALNGLKIFLQIRSSPVGYSSQSQSIPRIIFTTVNPCHQLTCDEINSDELKLRAKNIVHKLGAQLTLSESSADITVFHNGSAAFLENAKVQRLKVVSLAWLFDCREKNTRLNTDPYEIIKVDRHAKDITNFQQQKRSTATDKENTLKLLSNYYAPSEFPSSTTNKIPFLNQEDDSQPLFEENDVGLSAACVTAGSSELQRTKAAKNEYGIALIDSIKKMSQSLAERKLSHNKVADLADAKLSKKIEFVRGCRKRHREKDVAEPIMYTLADPPPTVIILTGSEEIKCTAGEIICFLGNPTEVARAINAEKSQIQNKITPLPCTVENKMFRRTTTINKPSVVIILNSPDDELSSRREVSSKVLYSLASGTPLLTYQWVLESLSASGFLAYYVANNCVNYYCNNNSSAYSGDALNGNVNNSLTIALPVTEHSDYVSILQIPLSTLLNHETATHNKRVRHYLLEDAREHISNKNKFNGSREEITSSSPQLPLDETETINIGEILEENLKKEYANIDVHSVNITPKLAYNIYTTLRQRYLRTILYGFSIAVIGQNSSSRISGIYEILINLGASVVRNPQSVAINLILTLDAGEALQEEIIRIRRKKKNKKEEDDQNIMSEIYPNCPYFVSYKWIYDVVVQQRLLDYREAPYLLYRAVYVRRESKTELSGGELNNHDNDRTESRNATNKLIIEAQMDEEDIAMISQMDEPKTPSLIEVQVTPHIVSDFSNVLCEIDSVATSLRTDSVNNDNLLLHSKNINDNQEELDTKSVFPEKLLVRPSGGSGTYKTRKGPSSAVKQPQNQLSTQQLLINERSFVDSE